MFEIIFLIIFILVLLWMESRITRLEQVYLNLNRIIYDELVGKLKSLKKDLWNDWKK